MDGRNNSGNNNPLSLYSDAEITELAKKMAVNNSQFTEEDYIKLIKSSYVPKERKVVRIDQEHDVIYYAAEEDEIKELEKSPKQSGSSTGQIYNTLRNSPEAVDFTLPDMKEGFSYKGKETVDRPMQRIENDIPPGYKRMTMWSHELQDFCIATVPEKTPELTSEEYERYSSINPK